jgi:hypothetical protein
MSDVVAERRVTVGSAAAPVAPLIVMTALLGDPTLYEPGEGAIDTTM